MKCLTEATALAAGDVSNLLQENAIVLAPTLAPIKEQCQLLLTRRVERRRRHTAAATR